MTTNCKQCNSRFSAFPSSKRKFCSHLCYNNYHRKHSNEWNKEYLKDPEFKNKQKENARKQMAALSSIGVQARVWKMRQGLLRIRKFKWSNNYGKCVECESNRRKYAGLGMCGMCYQRYQRAEKIHFTYFEDGKFYGHKGVLDYADNGSTIQCHLCGNYYKHLGVHVVLGHKVEIEKYKEEFEINSTFGLVNDGIKTKLANSIRDTLKKGIHPEVKYAREHIGELAKRKKYRKLRLQAVLNLKGKPPNWFLKATPGEVKEWQNKIRKGSAEVVDSRCAVCDIPIKAHKGQATFTYCKNCRRLAYNASIRRYNKKLKQNPDQPAGRHRKATRKAITSDDGAGMITQ